MRKAGDSGRTQSTTRTVGVKKHGASKKPPVTPLMCHVTWTDPKKPPSSFFLDADFDPKEETVHICLNLELRLVSSIEFRPMRRPLLCRDGSVDPGHIEDAIRLANS